MALRLDLVGSRYGYLTVIGRAEPWVYQFVDPLRPVRHLGPAARNAGLERSLMHLCKIDDD